MPREGFRPEELTYDFDRDVWVEDAFVRPNWRDRELAAPATPPEPGRWFKPPLPLNIRREAPLLFVVIATLIAYFMAAYGFLMVVLALPAWGFWYAFTGGRYEPFATPVDVRLLENPDDPDVCLVEVTIFRDGSPTGTDRGVAWFEGGRLLFSGHRTSFALGGEDVLPRNYWPRESADGAFGTLPPFALPLRMPWGSAHLAFVALPHGGESLRQESRFFERLRTFRLRPPVSRGPRQWPPF